MNLHNDGLSRLQRLAMISLIAFTPAACFKMRNTGASLGFVRTERGAVNEICRNSSKVSRMSVIKLSSGRSLVAIDANPCGKASMRLASGKAGTNPGTNFGDQPLAGEAPFAGRVPSQDARDPLVYSYPGTDYGYQATAADRKKPVFIFAPSEISDANIVNADNSLMEEARRQGFRVVDMSGLSSDGIERQLTSLRRSEPGIFADNRTLVYMSAHGQVRQENGQTRHVSTIQGEHYVAETGTTEWYDDFEVTADRIQAINRGLGQEFFNSERSVIFNSSCYSGQSGRDLGPGYSGPAVINASGANQISGTGEVYELMRMMNPDYARERVGSADGSVTPRQFADYLNRQENQLGNASSIQVATQYFTDFNDEFSRQFNARHGIASDVSDADVTTSRDLARDYAGNILHTRSFFALPGGSVAAPVNERVTTATRQTIEITGDGNNSLLIPSGRQTRESSPDIPSASRFDSISQGARIEETWPGTGSADQPYVVDEGES